MSIDYEPLTRDDELAALVRTGGNPYILINLVEPETGKIELITAGFSSEQVVLGLREAADQLAAALIEESTRVPAVGDFDHLPKLDSLGEALERAKQL
jgi:hypothetical protein